MLLEIQSDTPVAAEGRAPFQSETVWWRNTIGSLDRYLFLYEFKFAGCGDGSATVIVEVVGDAVVEDNTMIVISSRSQRCECRGQHKDQEQVAFHANLTSKLPENRGSG